MSDSRTGGGWALIGCTTLVAAWLTVIILLGLAVLVWRAAV